MERQLLISVTYMLCAFLFKIDPKLDWSGMLWRRSVAYLVRQRSHPSRNRVNRFVCCNACDWSVVTFYSAQICQYFQLVNPCV